jgi:hypothetical protein
MSVSLYIHIEEWRTIGNGGMKRIFRDDEAFPKVFGPQIGDPGDYDRDIRPADFALWRRSIVALSCNVEVWLRGLDALEADPDLWILCSS